MEKGALLRASDPMVNSLADIPELRVYADPYDAVCDADAIVLQPALCTQVGYLRYRRGDRLVEQLLKVGPGDSVEQAQSEHHELVYRHGPAQRFLGLGPVAVEHVLGRVEHDYRAAATDRYPEELALVEPHRPVAEAPLVGAHLLEVDVPRADDLTAATLHQQTAGGVTGHRGASLAADPLSASIPRRIRRCGKTERGGA